MIRNEKIDFQGFSMASMDFNQAIGVIRISLEEKRHLSVGYIDEWLMLRSYFSRKIRQSLKEVDLLFPSTKRMWKMVQRFYPHYRYNYLPLNEFYTPVLKFFTEKQDAYLQVQFILLGGQEKNNQFMVDVLKKYSPNSVIFGGYGKSFTMRRRDDILSIVKKADIRVLLLDLGKTESLFWYAESKPQLGKQVVFISQRLFAEREKHTFLRLWREGKKRLIIGLFFRLFEYLLSLPLIFPLHIYVFCSESWKKFKSR